MWYVNGLKSLHTTITPKKTTYLGTCSSVHMKDTQNNAIPLSETHFQFQGPMGMGLQITQASLPMGALSWGRFVQQHGTM